MRAWHLLLAVLATLLTIVQVASTEDNSISSRFIKAIQPIKKDNSSNSINTNPIYNYNNNHIEHIATKQKPTTALIPTATMANATALMDFYDDDNDRRHHQQHHHQQQQQQQQQQTATIVHKPHKKSDSDRKQQKQQLQHKQKQVLKNINSIVPSENHAGNIAGVVENTEEVERNVLSEINSSAIVQQYEVTSYQENLTEDKKEHNKLYKKKQQQKMSHNNKKIEQVVQVQVQDIKVNEDVEAEEEEEEHRNQKHSAEDDSATAATQQQNHLQNQQQTQPASQLQQQTQQQHQQQLRQHQQHHNHHHQHQRQHQHQHHHHHNHQQQQQQQQQHDSTTSITTIQTSDNLSSSTSTYSSPTSASATSSFPYTTSSSSSSSTISSSIPMDIDEDMDVVAEDDEPQADAVIPEDGPRTYSNKEIIGDKVKPDPSTLVEIENSLLSLFNMKRPPKIDRSKIIIPEAMKQLYAQIMGHELNSVNIPKPGLLTKSANTVRSFTHQDSKIDDRFPHHHRFRLYFDIKSIPAEEKLKAAELQLTRDAISHASLNPRLANRTRYQVLVYDITRVGVRGKREPSYLLLDNKTIRLNSTETVSLDVQPAVDRWLASPKKNFGLLVEVRTSRSLKPAPHHHVRLRRSADEEHDTWQHKQPLLFTYTDDGRHKSRSIRDVSTRSKRAGGGHHRRSHRRKNNEAICRRHSLYVDFADVGWSDWIVAPPGYDAFYCQGKCPFPLAEHLNSTNHAVVQTIVNNIDPFKVPTACCVPTQLEGISMLYLNDQNTVVLKNYQDMTVVGCGCR